MTDSSTRKLFIIEDEKHNRDLLADYIHEYFADTIEVAGSAASIADSLLFLKDNEVDILLLDIELSDGRVFDLLNQINYKKYKLVFITGYSEHAIKAIKYSAVDYLLKPVILKELVAALKKVLSTVRLISPELDDLIARKKFELDDYLVVNGLHTIEKIPFESISHMEAEGIYTIIYHNGNRTVSSRPIGIYEDVLPESRFFRCHKSFIVNKFYIKKIDMKRGLYLELHNGVNLQVAVRKKEEFMTWFKSEN